MTQYLLITEELDPELVKFDFIILSGVFEHLLPIENEMT